jgi:AbiTii/TIR domain
MAHSVEKLQHEITDPRNSVGTILQKAILVANEFKDQRFLDWAGREVNGYGSPDGDTEYRKLKGQYVAVTSDGRTLPIVWDKDDAKLKARFVTLPLAEIEALLSGGGNTFAVTVNVDPRSLTKIELEPGDRIGFSLTRATLSGFLQAVRQRVLDWTMTLKALPEGHQQVRSRNMNWDLFISHASEDKDDVARPLADKFIELGLSVWYDEYTLTVGDSLRRSIDRGLASP